MAYDEVPNWQSVLSKIGTVPLVALTSTLAPITLPAHAGPDDTTKLFMNRPATLLDLGMLRLNLLLDEIGDESYYPSGLPSPYVSYHWDRDRIVISVIKFSHDSASKEGEELCAEWISFLRARANVSSKTGEAAGGSYFVDQFTHSGFTNESITQATPKLDRKFQLRCSLNIRNKSKNSERYFRTITVTAPLLGTSYSVQIE